MFTLKEILARRIGKEILVLKLQFREAYRGFHKLDEIGNNANIDIRGFTT